MALRMSAGDHLADFVAVAPFAVFKLIVFDRDFAGLCSSDSSQHQVGGKWPGLIGSEPDIADHNSGFL